MELIKTLREKHCTSRQKDFHHQAVDLITLSDFDDCIYIAFNGVPLVPIEKDWKSDEILQQLSMIRQNYVNVKMRDNNLPNVTTVV